MAGNAYDVNPMDDMRNAKETVSLFQKHIERLELGEARPRSAELMNLASSTVKRNGSGNSSSDGGSSRRGLSSSSLRKWNKGVGKEWAESPLGALWQHISNALEDVAAQFQGVDPTALKEFASTREIMELGTEFVRTYRRGDNALAAVEKPPYAANSLFWHLQTVKQGDASAAQWTRASAERRRDWDLSDHLARFVLLADAHREKADREDWNTWNTNFATNTSLYLCVLRCFIIRDARQRAAAQERQKEKEKGKEKETEKEKEKEKEKGQTQDRDPMQGKRSSLSGSSRFSRSSRGGSN